MTKDEAIEQLDWYFDYDNGGAAEDKTKEAYSIIRNIAFEYDKYEGKRKELMSINMIWHRGYPKEDGRYLVTTCGLSCIKYVSICRFANSLKEISDYDFRHLLDDRSGWFDYNDEYGYYEIDAVIAWTELPEPYNKEIEED